MIPIWQERQGGWYWVFENVKEFRDCFPNARLWIYPKVFYGDQNKIRKHDFILFSSHGLIAEVTSIKMKAQSPDKPWLRLMKDQKIKAGYYKLIYPIRGNSFVDQYTIKTGLCMISFNQNHKTPEEMIETRLKTVRRVSSHVDTFDRCIKSGRLGKTVLKNTEFRKRTGELVRERLLDLFTDEDSTINAISEQLQKEFNRSLEKRVVFGIKKLAREIMQNELKEHLPIDYLMGHIKELIEGEGEEKKGRLAPRDRAKLLVDLLDKVSVPVGPALPPNAKTATTHAGIGEQPREVFQLQDPHPVEEAEVIEETENVGT